MLILSEMEIFSSITRYIKNNSKGCVYLLENSDKQYKTVDNSNILLYTVYITNKSN